MRASLIPGGMVGERYRLERVLGQGGMGVVWSATHTLTRRAVALKLMRDPVGAGRRQRFLREARAAAAVDHPSIVRVHDVFELDDGTPVLVMDLLSGETLRCRLDRERTLGLSDAASILLPVISAVGSAHAQGIVHRDLKPDNIFLLRDEKGEAGVKVLDFGIAKLTSKEAAETQSITGTGTTLGTPAYMAPEQAYGHDVDHLADVWALGVTLYEMLVGSRPIEGHNIGQIVKNLLSCRIAPLPTLVPGIPSDVSTLVERMLSYERTRRPKDLREPMEVLSRHADVRVRPFDAPAVALRVEEEDSPAEALMADAGTQNEARPSQTTQSATRQSAGGWRKTIAGALAIAALAGAAWRWSTGKTQLGEQAAVALPSEANSRAAEATARLTSELVTLPVPSGEATAYEPGTPKPLPRAARATTVARKSRGTPPAAATGAKPASPRTESARPAEAAPAVPPSGLSEPGLKPVHSW